MEPAKKLDERYAYADYSAWPEDERWELIDGIAYAMAPSPSFVHQSVSKKIFRQLDSFLQGKPCEAFYAPFDVRLNADGKYDTNVKKFINVYDLLISG